MTIQLKIPEVGESVSEGQIGDWLKQEGEFVRRDEAVVQIESDKATVEVYAPAGGKLTKILKKKGEVAQVGDVVGLLEEAPEPVSAPPATAAPAPAPTPAQRPAERAPSGNGQASSPAVEAKKPPPAAKAARTLAPQAPQGIRQSEMVPMTPIRRKIAQRLVEAQATAALLTTFNEADMSALSALRQKHKDSFQEKHGVKLGLMSFFVKAVIEALKLYPQINAEIRGEQIVYHHYYDIGIAVGGGKGLVVPVLRNAERMSFAEIEKAIADFADRAAEGKIELEELKGGTFTISNGGIFGSLLSTPIINPPQSGILGLHTIQQRPVAREGQVVIRPMMYIALTYDHRIVDGREAVLFLKHIAGLIEEPTRILLEI